LRVWWILIRSTSTLPPTATRWCMLNFPTGKLKNERFANAPEQLPLQQTFSINTEYRWFRIFYAAAFQKVKPNMFWSTWILWASRMCLHCAATATKASMFSGLIRTDIQMPTNLLNRLWICEKGNTLNLI